MPLRSEEATTLRPGPPATLNPRPEILSQTAGAPEYCRSCGTDGGLLRYQGSQRGWREGHDQGGGAVPVRGVRAGRAAGTRTGSS
eukprot:3926479-Rhodomonas_salina.1